MSMFSQGKPNQENKRRVKKVKRSLNLNLNFSGLKLLLPVAMFSVVMVAMVLGAMKLNDVLAVTYWKIEAETSVKLQIESFLQQRQQRSFWQTRASVMQQELLTHIPDIKQVDVQRMLPEGLVIKAISRQPIALWERQQKSKKRVMLVDSAGVAYRTLNRGESLDLPILRLAEDDVARAATVLQQLYTQDVSKVTRLSEVIVTMQQWRFNFSGGERWILNQINLEQDLQQIERILAKPRWSHGRWRMDARIPQRWFVRPARQEVI